MSIEKRSEFGKLTELIEDPTIEEVWINSPHRIFVARSGVSELTNLVMSALEVRELVERLLMWGGRRLDLSHPFVDARLPDGSRLHVAIPEVTATHWAVNIRKHLVRGKSLDELADMGVMNSEVSSFLEKAVSHGLNILVSGSTQAGKTTLLNALVSSVPSGNRVVTIEEVFELKPKISDCVALQTRPANLQGEGEIPLRRLIKEALRMRPSQLVVGEIREAESLDLLIALNSGIPGMATIHANSARDAVSKLQTLPLLAGENISFDFIAPIVAASIDLVVHTTITGVQNPSRTDDRSRDFSRERQQGPSRERQHDLSRDLSRERQHDLSRDLSRERRSDEGDSNLNGSLASSNHGTFPAGMRSGSQSPTGFRRVVEVLAVTGRVENRHVETEPVFTYHNGSYVQGLGNPARIFERASSHYSEAARG